MAESDDTPTTPAPVPAPEALARIENINIEEEMRSSYIDYSMSVIIGRALPDVRDGLKPVHRRCLFAMWEISNTHEHPYKKSARIVGEVMGKFHPHGDQAIYDTIVRMAQDFSMRYLLVDGQGNFGSIDGDPPAAMRYTEVRMQRLAEELLIDIDKETVEFGPNYDNKLQQPLVLPSKAPNLLLNGSTGIAVGMATNIPPHNLGELVDATLLLIDNPAVAITELMKRLKGPDFPTGGIICGLSPIESMYRTGRGQMKVRGRATIEETRQGKEAIIITEIPYAVNKQTLIENIAHLVGEKRLEGISDIRDESNREGIRVMIELKRGVQPKVVLNNLFKHTQLETTFGAIMLAIHEGRPKVMNLKELLQCFVRHRFEVVTRRTKFDLAKAEARAHILEGLKIALDHLTEVVKTIRESKNRDDAKTQLMAKFRLSEIQTNAILDMRLYQLTGLERDKLEAEYLEVIKLISYLRDLLENEHKIYGLIKDELLDLKQKYGDSRKTDLVPEEGEINMEDLVANRGCVITISHTGYIKRVPVDTYKAQRRGGKGVAGMDVKEEDFVEHLFVANMHDYILFFTSAGRVYCEKVYEIPESGRTSRGKAIVNLLNMQSEEKIAAMIKVREFTDTTHLVMATAKGIVKKSNLTAYANPRKNGIIAIAIEEGDRLIAVKMTNGQNEVVLATEQGMSIRFPESQLRDQARDTVGVYGIRLDEGDNVVGLEIVDKDATFLVCTQHGYGKRTSFEEYRVQSRAGSGVMAIRTSDRNGKVVAARAVKETDALMLITAKGQMVRTSLNDLRVIGRVSQGVRLIRLDEGDELVSAVTFEPEDTEFVEVPAVEVPATPPPAIPPVV